jgi:virulence factor
MKNMSSSSSNANGTRPRRPIRVGLIGCGNIWRAVYHPVLTKLADRVKVTAFCDISPGPAEATATLLPDARRHPDADSLFRQEPLDAALVLTSERANAPTALAALQAGLAVFLEKPPAVTVPEWRRLADAAEASTGPGRIYTAFNRRQTVLFRNWRPPKGASLRRVRGVLRRQGRGLATFPFTAVHLIDSAQFFSGRPLAEARSFFSEDECGPHWRIQGVLEGGAACELTCVPDGPDNAEHLVIETEDRIWELHFPNQAHTKHPGGLLVSRPVSPAPDRDADATVVQGDLGDDPLEATGHVPSVRDFLDRIENAAWDSSPHQLRRCGPTIALLEEMLGQGKAGSG